MKVVLGAGLGLINARIISKPLRVHTFSTEMSVWMLNFSIWSMQREWSEQEVEEG